MSDLDLSRNTLIAVERRRKIYELAMQKGSVSVTQLVEILSVGASTIRHDLDILHKEGKLIRSHGGAVVKDTNAFRQPYSQVRDANIKQKSCIGEAALRYIPESGSVMMGAGTTVYQMAVRIPEGRQLHVLTVSPDVASYLAVNKIATVDLLGGRLRLDSYATDCSLSEEALELLFWDVTFLGVTAIDVVRGISSIDLVAAQYERKVIEHGNKVVVLCDSSKVGKFSYAVVGPVSMIDVLITDSGISKEMVKEFQAQGVEVVIADLIDNA